MYTTEAYQLFYFFDGQSIILDKKLHSKDPSHAPLEASLNFVPSAGSYWRLWWWIVHE